MMSTRMYCMVLGLLLSFVFQGCAGEVPGTGLTGRLATDQPGHQLSFIAQDTPVTKSFLLYNDGASAVSVRGIAVRGDEAKVFSLVSPPKLPLLLQPGKERGLTLRVQLKPSPASQVVARLAIQLDGAADFYVGLRKTTLEGRLHFACAGLFFGQVKYGQKKTESCVLQNRGSEAVRVSGLLFHPDAAAKGKEETKRGEFSLKGASFPLVLAPNAKRTLFVTYAPQDFESLHDRGRFVVESDLRPRPGEAKASIAVRGNTLAKLISIVPQMETCGSDSDCTWLDPKLRCRPFLLESRRRCQYEQPKNKGFVTQAALKFPFVTTGKQVTQGVVIRSVGTLPVTVAGLVLLDGKGSKWKAQALGGAVVLKPYEEKRVLFTLQGEVKTLEQGEFGIRSDADNARQARVRVSVDAPHCQLHIQAPFTAEGLLDAGASAVGLSTTTPFTIRNRGGRECKVESISLDSSSSFVLPAPATLPVYLGLGVTLSGTISFAPKGGASRFQTTLRVKSNMPQRETLAIPVLGTTHISCVEVTPSFLDFGTVGATCEQKDMTITVRNVGREGCGSFSLRKVSLRPGSSQAISIVSAPGPAVSLKPGSSAKIKVRYIPKKWTEEKGVLLLETSLKERGNVALPMRAFGGDAKHQVDTFRQLKRPKADVLWVIDNSRSMGDELAQLSQNFQAYINWQVRLNVEYHTMVTTTDVSGKHYPPGCAVGPVKIISNHTTNPIQAFMTNVKVGTGGSSQEQGLEAAYQAISPKMQSDPDCNKGFYRKDASLAIIFVSDEDDQSPKPVKWYVQQFKALKGLRNLDLIRASAIVGPRPEGCVKPGVGDAKVGARYLETAKQLKGVQESICNRHWGGTLSNLGSVTFGYRTQFFLSKAADRTSIVVRVDGVPVQEDAQDGWQFDHSNNSVNFSKSQTPRPGARIDISYRLRCFP